MATFVRTSWLFAVTTDPTDATSASPHSGGWSESHWCAPSDFVAANARTLASRRANLLPGQGSIIGYRLESFDLTGNKLSPLGATSGRFLYPGLDSRDLNLPQDSLMMNGAGSGVPNAARFNLRCIPDGIITRGEYQPSPAFKGALTLYSNGLIAVGYGFIGRVKTGLSARVNSIAAGVVHLNGAVGGVANTDFLRLNRVYDDLGNPVKGTFLITNITGNAYTVSGLAGVSVSQPSGSARIDALDFFQYGVINPARAVVRKIGRPFEQYRGRASARA